MSRPFVPVIHGAMLDRPDEAETIETAGIIAETLDKLGYASEVVPLGLDLAPLAALSRREAFAVFNLVEALDGDGSLSYLPCAVLDHLRLPYTGARTGAYYATLSKLRTKRVFREAGLPTAPWWEDARAVPREVTVIVKPDSEHGSLGVDASSVVAGAEAAREIAARQMRFGARFFAEAFIDGREFGVSMLQTTDGVRALPVSETRFDQYPEGRPRIMDYEAKWVPESIAYRSNLSRFGLEETEPELADTLIALAHKAWAAFGLNGYARVDFRVGSDGPMLLEVNVNSCLSPEAAFADAAERGGLFYGPLIAHILAAASQP